MPRHDRLGLALAIFLAVSVGLASCDTSADNADQASFTIGLVTNTANGMRNVDGFVGAMAGLGYVEGVNVTYVFAGGPLVGDDLRDGLTEMVSAGVDLIFTAGTPTGVAARDATAGTGTPVVFGVIADPIEAGVMTDLSRPGGNMTGVKAGQSHGRRLELLLELDPATHDVLVPFNPADAAATSAVQEIAEVAAALGVELHLQEAHSPEDVTSMLTDISDEVDAIFLVPDSLVNAHLADILSVADERRLLTSGPSTAQTEEGALISYGFVHREAGAQAARIADQVLRGANPGAIPVEDTDSFLMINLVTATTIGLEVPHALLQQADFVLRPDNE